VQKTNWGLLLSGFLISSIFFSAICHSALGNVDVDISILYEQANKHLQNGELREAVNVYDEILLISPENIDALLMKGIALSNLDRHPQSMKELYKVLEREPQNVSALLGMGVGFGNFGEYKEAQKYFDTAYSIVPENHVVINYKNFAESIIKKYPYNEVEKPEFFQVNIIDEVPAWVKNNAGWWANGQIPDSTFIDGIEFLIKKKIIVIPDLANTSSEKTESIPTWVKNTAGWWADDRIADSEFLAGIYFLVENGLLIVDILEIAEMTEEEKKIADRNRWQFARYLDRIEKTVSDDKRYIEYPNPSGDVIKKFLRDYIKWNFEQQIEIGNKSFPNPTYTLADGIYHMEYKIYINKQPIGLPLDHVSTLVNSFKYWEGQELQANDGNPVKIHFVVTESKIDANLWVTWVVRDIGENVLGHANLGKGVIEVGLGGYACDGNFQLFQVETVETIMTHELGHGIGLKHTTESDSIMYPTIKETNYAYCLLDVK
tara:strand:+ start:1491 stop:2957 length:1467 start_codon:yes stop_codon:yes gene_type:complete